MILKYYTLERYYILRYYIKGWNVLTFCDKKVLRFALIPITFVVNVIAFRAGITFCDVTVVNLSSPYIAQCQKNKT